MTNHILSKAAELESYLSSEVNLMNLYIEQVIILANKGKAIEHTNDERNYSYDIKLLFNKVLSIKSLIDESEDVIALEVSNMWLEAQSSLDEILTKIGVENISTKEDYDNGSWVLARKQPKKH